jgi:hypothetical protein
MSTPSIPTNIVLTPGNNQVTVSWTTPVYFGGATSLLYTVRLYNSTKSYLTSDTSYTFTGLPNNVPCTFSVCSMNSVGSSPFVTSSSVLPGDIPGPPINVIAISGTRQASVSWSQPISIGGLPIISYTVTSSPDGITTTTSNTYATVTGLTNGGTYTFTVTATNARGTSIPSNVSTSITLTNDPSIDNSDFWIVTGTSITGWNGSLSSKIVKSYYNPVVRYISEYPSKPGSFLIIPSIVRGISITSLGGGLASGAGLFRNKAIFVEQVIISPGITSIGNATFRDTFGSFNTIVIPPSVKTIGDFAFQNSDLQYMPDLSNVTTIGTDAFAYNKNGRIRDNSRIPRFTVPIIPTVSSGIFANSSLSPVVIPQGTTIIPLNMFYRADVIQVTIPDSVTLIAHSAFCRLGGWDESYGKPAPDGTTFMFAPLYNNLVIDDYAFQLAKINSTTVLPEGLITIGACAFELSNAINITIPSTVTTIKQYAFRKCSLLKHVTFKGRTPPPNMHLAFIGINATQGANVTFHYPNGADGTVWLNAIRAAGAMTTDVTPN